MRLMLWSVSSLDVWIFFGECLLWRYVVYSLYILIQKLTRKNAELIFGMVFSRHTST